MKEASTRYTEDIHLDHLLRLIGKKTSVASISREVLQTYVNVRGLEQSRGRTISHITVKKESGSLSAVWNKWALPMGLVKVSAPTKNLLFRKVPEPTAVPNDGAEADFGHIYVDFSEGRKQIPVRIVVWSYSNYPFVMAMPSERTEAILAGMVEAFHFFGCVSHEVWWDNPRTVASQIFVGRERRVNERYAALASHYAFDPLFCMPARGNEKPYAETRVRVMQRQWATPVPRVANLDELNALFRARCLDEAKRTVAGYSESIGQRFERDRAAAVALPAHRFDACVLQPGQVDKYQTVRFDRNRYSVPRSCAFRSVMVKGYIDRIEVVAGGDVVARHQRSYGRDEQILDPLHYLAALGRRPAALDHARVGDYELIQPDGTPRAQYR